MAEVTPVPRDDASTPARPQLRLPDFFIVGAPKCGTTALYHYLRQHAQVFMPEKKEPHFYGSDLQAPHFIRDRQAYAALFAAARPDQTVGEASIWYLCSERAAAEIKADRPEARAIIMLRNPVDMMYSLHSQRLYSGRENLADFAAALAAEDERRLGRNLPAYPYPVNGLLYREVADYAPQVERYLRAFGRQRVHVIVYDDFASATERCYAETCTFLGISAQPRPRFEIVNPNKRRRSRSVLDGQRRIYPLVRPLARSAVPPPARRAVFRLWTRLNTRYAPRPPLAPELRRRLQDEFRPGLEALSRLLDRDLSHWCDGP
jgi:hypothetical protein